MRHLASVIAAALGSMLVCGVASAQDPAYPAKALRLVIPFPAGGGSDLIARVTAQKLSANVGQPVVVDNRAGASGNIAAETVAKAPADGYTVLFGNSSLSISPAVFQKLNYDPVRDLAPVTMVSSYPFILVVHPSLPVRNVRELVNLAKAKPGALAYSSSGAGTMSHLAMELLRLKTHIKFTHLPYKGAAPGGVALVSGESQLSFLVPPVAQGYIKSGRIRALGVAGPTRAAVIPEVPTMVEAGIAGHEALQWNGFFVPARTPQPVIERLQREVAKALGDAEVRSRFEAEGATPAGTTPAEFSAFFRRETEKWADVAQKSGTRLD